MLLTLRTHSRSDTDPSRQTFPERQRDCVMLCSYNIHILVHASTPSVRRPQPSASSPEPPSSIDVYCGPRPPSSTGSSSLCDWDQTGLRLSSRYAFKPRFSGSSRGSQIFEARRKVDSFRDHHREEALHRTIRPKHAAQHIPCSSHSGVVVEAPCSTM